MAQAPRQVRLAGAPLERSRHVCAFFNNADEAYGILVPFIREGLDRGELNKLVIDLEQEMYVAAEELRFEYAAKLRDEIKDLRRELNALAEA